MYDVILNITITMIKTKLPIFALLIAILWILRPTGCAKPLDGVWTNGFTARSSGFERLSIFIDIAVKKTSPKGKAFVSISESIAAARALDRTLARLLSSKGYKIGVSERFFVGSYCDKPLPVSYGSNSRIYSRRPPFHMDPNIERVPELALDLRLSFQAFAKMIGEGEKGLQNAALARESARKIAGNYHTSGFVLVLGQAAGGDPALSPQAPPTHENILNVVTSFLAVGYFEGATGRLVHYNMLIMPKGLPRNAFESALLRFHTNFPEARYGGRFTVPPPPRLGAAKSAPGYIAIPRAPRVKGMRQVDYQAILRQRGGVSMSERPGTGLNTVNLPSGTTARVIGTMGIYSKIILDDGRIGWVATSTVWIKKKP